MTTVETDESTLGEIKLLAKDFLDHAIQDVDYEAKHPEVLETIGLRMAEVLFPKEYKEYYWKLCDAIKEDFAKEDAAKEDK